MISDYFKLAFRNLTKRKLRSWLTIVGIVISIATIFMLISISLGLQAAVEEQFKILGTDKFFIQPRGQIAGPGTTGAVQLTIKDVDAIEKISGVKDLTYFAVSPVKVEINGDTRYTNVVGFPLENAELFLENGAYDPEEGRTLREGDSGVVAIGYQFKHGNWLKKPAKINDKILLNGQEFKVRAITKQIGNSGDDRIILMSIEDFKLLFNVQEQVDQIMVQVDDVNNIDEVVERVEKRLKTLHGVTDKTRDFTILTPEELLESFGNILKIITSFLLAVAGISLLVGGIGIANTMFTSVLERTKEIGTMKAVGAKNSDILTLFLIESGLLGLTGGILGVLLGLSVAKLIEYIAVNQLQTNLLQVATPFYLIFGCLAFAFIAGAISGIWPAHRASKLRAVDALRYE
ncbi:MAG: ABC transporter permease [Nanoarchaeota archaeon]|nr:ABC transporter permease [Nanoarchaeota archaeon]